MWTRTRLRSGHSGQFHHSRTAATWSHLPGYIGLFQMSSFRSLLVLVISLTPAFGATFGTLVTRSSPIADLVIDETRTPNRLYAVDTNANAVEVYLTNANPPRLAPGTNTIKVEKTPLAAALSRSGRFLYVVCYDASALDIIDL